MSEGKCEDQFSVDSLDISTEDEKSHFEIAWVRKEHSGLIGIRDFFFSFLWGEGRLVG